MKVKTYQDYLDLFNQKNIDNDFELIEVKLKEKFIIYKHLECGTILKKSLTLFKVRQGCKYCTVNTRNKTMLEKYGVVNAFQSKDLMEEAKKTLKEKYGVDNPAKSKQIQDKIKQTNLEKYGGIAPLCNKKIYEKVQQTKKELYSDENYNNKEQAIKTNLELYGVEYTMQNEKVRKLREENNLKMYGVKNTLELKEVRDQINKTVREKYGVENISQVENIIRKIYETKTINNSFNISNGEKIIYSILLKNFKNVKKQYKDKRYPFNCDFYLPEYDLFIEYQGSWVHGNCIFDKNNKEHLKIIEEYNNKSQYRNFKNKKKSFYKQAIYIWSIRDPLKREIAKQNNLKYLEIFSFKDEQDLLDQINKKIS